MTCRACGEKYAFDNNDPSIFCVECRYEYRALMFDRDGHTTSPVAKFLWVVCLILTVLTVWVAYHKP